jgi:hypothetical protein
MARLFLIALGFALAGMCEAVVRWSRALPAEWFFRTVLACVYLIAGVVLVARLVCCWGGCGA